MKKYQITVCLILLTLYYSYGQYGLKSYPHVSSFLTAAKTTSINTNGFVMAGVYPSATGSGADFVIDKTDVNGDFSLAGFFSQEYIIPTLQLCGGGNFVYNHGCTGVDIIETNPGLGINFALAGVYNDGVFFVTLNNTGAIVTQRYWQLQGIYGGTKPTIVESAVAGDYYICGFTPDGPYVIKVQASGAHVWGRLYNSSQFTLLPRDLIENGSDLIVVGRAESSLLNAEAFFLSINIVNGNVNQLNFYSDNTGGDEWFNAIEYAASPTGGTGFIVGGFASSSGAPTANNAWMLKLDPVGGVIWSSLFSHYYEIVDVFERYNNVGNPHYEYFGLFQTPDNTNTNNLNIFKVDDVGTPYTPTPNLFKYAISAPVAGDYTMPQLDFVGTGAATGDGFVAFSTDVIANEHVMVKAWYDGINNCESRDAITSINGPGISQTPPLNTTSFPACFTSITIVSSGNQIVNLPCNWGAVPSGSNARTAQLTGLENNKEVEELIAVYPNPSNGVFTIEALEQSGALNIKLTNSIGQLIKTIDIPAESRNQKISVDFKELSVSEGLYFLNISNSNQNYTKKIMYSK